MPLPLLEKMMLPVGVLAVPGEVSLTVAVQVVPAATAAVLGAHTTAVPLPRVTARPVFPVEPRWLESPP